MAERLNRDPTYDLGRHIATGEKTPLSGDPAIRQYDAELDRNDPMEFPNPGDRFVLSVPSGQVDSSNRSQAVGLSPSDMGTTNGGGCYAIVIDLASASDCRDEPTKGGLSYGPRFAGGD